MPSIYIGTAGWPIPAPLRPAFPDQGSLLARYARRFNAVEINTSFHRPHRAATYARWAASVPPAFRFAVKLPKTITHELRLKESDLLLDAFLGQCTALGDRMGPVLVQLPPSLEFNHETLATFLAGLRARFPGTVVLEPRHASWFTTPVEELLTSYQVARVAADPALLPVTALPGGATTLSYFRLHGSPRMYYSAYEPDFLLRLAARLRAEAEAGREVWCIFDNTAAGAATSNALKLISLL